MQDSLLWVYEGQTQYWGKVLAARSGLWTQAQALDAWAEDAAHISTESGRAWRSLADTTNEDIINPRRPKSWEDYQRFEAYYAEGSLIWLEADTLIRERSGGRRSLDDFAARFFGVNDGSVTPLTYTFEDLVAALNAVERYDWGRFLRERLHGTGRPAPLDGLKRAGYQLAYTDQPNEQEKAEEHERRRTLLRYSLGIDIDEKDEASGTLLDVAWNSPAFAAGLTEGMRIVAVDGDSYSAEVLKHSITMAAKSTRSAPIELILRNGDRYLVARVDYHGDLRYPHLVREAAASGPSMLDAIQSQL
jgi:predicted metalloprotease with PDZ domain